MFNLSPAAQSIVDAYSEANDCYDETLGQIAAALRAASMTVLEEHLNCRGPLRNLDGGMHQFASRLLTIAAELERELPE